MFNSLRESRAARIVVAVLCAIYLFMPNFGVVEFLPDNLPFVGNLDEFAASFLLFSSLSLLPWVDSPNKLRWVVLGVIGVVSLIYLFNPTAGLLELLPDNIPVVGNFDELIAALGASSVIAQAWYPRLEEEKQKRLLQENTITYES
jgi:uncharacterized membrane protein YkvA (DUF1232 family)